jgi:hypothetical protein
MAEDRELLDTHTDSSHRSYRRAVKHERLGPLRLRSSTERVPLHELWIDRFVIYSYYTRLEHNNTSLEHNNKFNNSTVYAIVQVT